MAATGEAAVQQRFPVDHKTFICRGKIIALPRVTGITSRFPTAHLAFRTSEKSPDAATGLRASSFLPAY